MKKIFIKTLLSFIVAAIIISLYYAQIGFLETFENKTYDLRFILRGPQPASADIAIVTIDEKSIEELGRFPWTRKYFADLVDIVSKAGAKALLFDAFFPERESIKADSALARSVKRSGITTLAVVINLKEDGSGLDVIENLPELQGAAKNIAHINMTPDPDGVVRWSPLIIHTREGSYPSLSLTGAKDALGAKGIDVGDYELRLGKINIPVDDQMRMLINYQGADGIYEWYSFSDILKGRISKDALKDKILLVGATAIGIYDLRVTPFSNNSPGVEVNANILDNIVRGSFMKRGGIEALIDMVSIAVLALMTFHITLKVRAWIALPFVAVLTAGYVYFAYFMFLKGQWISMVYPVMGIILSFSSAASMRFFVVERKAKKIRTMFSSYVSKKIVDELVKHPEKTKIGGARKTLTILFTDVRGYTTFSERHTPEEVVNTLNEFLAAMTDVIMEYDGTLDKFLGDGIMAFWGAPVEQENHAELAVRCAQEMLKRMKGLQKKWQAEGKETLEFGIGLNTGEVIVGNIGVADKKIDYTVIGDNVNLTHRLQNLSREAKRAVISDALYQRVKDITDAECLGEVTVKGRQGSIKIYAVNSLR